MFSLICVWINGSVNNREAGDLRRYSGHYDVIVMTMQDELEQLERLRSEDTPRRLMITHTIGSQVKKIIDLELKTLQSRHDFQSQGQMTLKI